jgi:hypothetical protein
MAAIGAIVAIALHYWPWLNAFDYMPFVTIFLSMGIVELAFMFSGRLIGPMPLHIRFFGLGFGFAAYSAVNYALPIVAK